MDRCAENGHQSHGSRYFPIRWIHTRHSLSNRKRLLQRNPSLRERTGAKITTVQADLADFAIEPQHWDGIVSIFCHLPPELRCDVHRCCVEGLRPGGMMLLEAYTPAQLEYRTGGPPAADMMMDAQSLRTELAGLEFLHLQERVRDVHEGEFHNGPGAVVQALARKL